jgi:hypothetical protein
MNQTTLITPIKKYPNFKKEFVYLESENRLRFFKAKLLINNYIDKQVKFLSTKRYLENGNYDRIEHLEVGKLDKQFNL